MKLTTSQSAAVQYVSDLAKARDATNQQSIHEALAQASLPGSLFESTARTLREEARVELNFHPDRKAASGLIVAASLLAEGVYRSQFETQISNGSCTAQPGGYRYDWESRMFGCAYDRSTHKERPKYGALNLFNQAGGAAPRFGSCYLCLRPAVSQRTTFSYGDSVTNPDEMGTLQHFHWIWSAIVRDVLAEGKVLGQAGTTLPTLLAKLQTSLGPFARSRFAGEPSRNLDDYVEAQVHGDIRLDRDVEQMVVDPCFVGSEVGQMLVEAAKKYGFPLYYHRGLAVAVDTIPDDFRGEAVARLAKRIATGATITAKDVGAAALSLHDSPELWQEWASHEETLQQIKQLWHVIVQFGQAGGLFAT
jgi:hypothetical protein